MFGLTGMGVVCARKGRQPMHGTDTIPSLAPYNEMIVMRRKYKGDVRFIKKVATLALSQLKADGTEPAHRGTWQNGSERYTHITSLHQLPS